MYVVMGATGNTGAVVAETLLAKGEAVRVVVRDAAKGAAWTARGAEVAIANADDAAALAAAFAGAKGAYVMNPPSYQSADPLAETVRVGEAVAEAIRRSGLPHAVALSSIGAHQPAGTGIIGTTRIFETKLREAGQPLTVLRASYFMENWAAVLQPALNEGVLPTFLAPLDRAIPMVAVADIGRTAAELLLAGPQSARIVELGGPQDRTPLDAAAALAKLAGRPVQAVPAPLEACVPTLLGFGFAQRPAELMGEMYVGINNGTVDWQQDGTERRHGAVTLEQALAKLLGKVPAAA